MHEADRKGLICNLSRLELYTETKEAYKLMPEDKLLDQKIIMWAIKDLYVSPHRAMLNALTPKKVIFRYLKAKKYIQKNDNYRILELISYFSACLMDELEKEV